MCLRLIDNKNSISLTAAMMWNEAKDDEGTSHTRDTHSNLMSRRTDGADDGRPSLIDFDTIVERQL